MGMLICFFDRRGVVYREFVPPGQTVNARFYVDVLDRLRKGVLRVRLEIADSWKLQRAVLHCGAGKGVFCQAPDCRVALPSPFLGSSGT